MRYPWRTFVVVAVLLALDLRLTLHGYDHFHQGTDGPSVMSLRDMLGFVTSAILGFWLVGLVGLTIVRWRRRLPRRYDRALRADR